MNNKKILELVSPIPISVNHYIKPRGFIMYKNGKATCQISIYETSEAKQYKKDFIKYIKKELQNQNWNLTPNSLQHFYIDADFVFPRIDMDANNYWKILLDSITETQLIWLDDNVTCERVNSITYDSNNPHIKLKIYPVDYIGVFKSEKQLCDFKSSYCQQCSRMKNNCSILKKAIEGRVQDEINLDDNGNRICGKFKEMKVAKSKQNMN